MYICGKCQLPVSSDSDIASSHPMGDVIEVNNISLGITSPKHLRLLTDQIFDLSENYKRLSVQVLEFMMKVFS